MDTPTPRDPHGDFTLYGERALSINRRGLLAGVASVLAQPAAAVPLRVTAIGWQGTARVFQGETSLELTVRTRVEPFRRARSTSWITAKGEATARTLVIEPDDGWLEQGGARKPLPPALIAHERQQYGLYGYLLLAYRAREDEASLRLHEPGFPEARFLLDGGWPTSATYNVTAVEGAGSIEQTFTFAGVALEGERWFKRMTIFQADRKYFELTIADLTVERG